MKKRWWFGGVLAVLFLLSVSPAFGRNWRTTDTDLPESLQGLNQDQLDIVNKMDELNPAFPDKFNQQLFDLMIGGSQQPPIIRTGQATTLLPPVSPQTADEIGGTPGGVGLGPSPTDGPVVRPGGPTRPPVEEIDIGLPGDMALGLFFGKLFMSEEDAKELEEGVGEYIFWEFLSGSGHNFGDCIGANCIPSFGFPGEPFGGPPIGSWVHHDPGRTDLRFRSDAGLLADLNAGNFRAVETTLEGLVGKEVRRDPRGSAP